MDKPMIDALAERVERLERENRRLKRFGLAVVCVLAVVGIGAAQRKDDAAPPPPAPGTNTEKKDKPVSIPDDLFRPVVTRGLVLVGKDGTPRADLGTDKEGHTRL